MTKKKQKLTIWERFQLKRLYKMNQKMIKKTTKKLLTENRNELTKIKQQLVGTITANQALMKIQDDNGAEYTPETLSILQAEKLINILEETNQFIKNKLLGEK